jgi:hypothetical protein
MGVVREVQNVWQQQRQWQQVEGLVSTGSSSGFADHLQVRAEFQAAAAA